MLGVVVVCFCFRGFWGELLAQYLWDWRGYMSILALCCLPYVVRTCMTIFNLSFRSAMLPGRDYIFCVRNQLSKQGNDLLVPTATWLP
jgi:hypothetical protein